MPGPADRFSAVKPADERAAHIERQAQAHTIARDPSDPTIDQLAKSLWESVYSFATGLRSGEASLLGANVLVYSADPEDFLWARLLACFGAVVHFAAPRSIEWTLERHGAVSDRLFALLAQSRPDLDVLPLRLFGGTGATESNTNDSFQTTKTSLEAIRAAIPTSFDLVIARDALPDDVAGALDALDLLSSMVEIGGNLEVIASGKAPVSSSTARQIEESLGLHRLGMRAETYQEGAPGSPHTWRLSLIRLSDPLHEYPIEGIENRVVMAHTRARLEFAAGFVDGCEVLEAGCGTGVGARLFVARGARRVVGLDQSEAALALARERTADERIEYRPWDLNVAPLPFADASFDVVVFLEALEHLVEHETAIAELYRVLRPGGRLVVSVPAQSFEEQWAELNQYGNPYHRRVPTREEFEQLVGRFAQINYYRQFDVVGSVVVETSDPAPAGAFTTEPRALDRSISEVIAAVCVKTPADAATAITKSPSLGVYGNFQERQLDWERDRAETLRHHLECKRDLWGRLNRERFESWSSSEPLFVRLWHETGVPAVSGELIKPGEWMSVAHSRLRHELQLTGGRHIRARTCCWSASAFGEQLELTPLQQTPNRVRSVLFPTFDGRVGIRAQLYWLWRGAEEFWFLERTGWRRVDALASLTRWLYRRWAARPLQRLFPARDPLATEWNWMNRAVVARRRSGSPDSRFLVDDAVDPEQWDRHIEQDNARPDQPRDMPDGSLRIVQYVGALYPGGAERQLANLSIGLKRRGHDVAVLTAHALEGEAAHYRNLLDAAAIAVSQASVRRVSSKACRQIDWTLLQAPPGELQADIYRLMTELLARRPDVLNCWLDHANIIGAIAGLLAGVPAIVLGIRNYNPTHFPRLLAPFMQPWLRLLASSRRVHFLSNSRAGAKSYADWIGIPAERIDVVPNGVCLDQFPEPTVSRRQAARRALGLAEDAKVLCGVFRLDDEKRPGLFLDVVELLAGRIDSLRVLMAGAGPLESAIRSRIRQKGLDRVVQMLGRRQEIGDVLLASDVMLLTSSHEGCPNAALEAQLLGVPVVATSNGGTQEAILHGKTGYIAEFAEASLLAGHVHCLLDDDTRLRFSQAARRYVRESFDWDQMVEATVAVYRKAFEAEQWTLPQKTTSSAA